MPVNVRSLHHVTATVGDAQEDLDFFTGRLGLRLIKQTVNFDNAGVYHFYYGNTYGEPGSIMTTFPYKGKGVAVGRKGAGQVKSTSFSVPPSSISFWRDRLSSEQDASGTDLERFGEEVIVLSDPSGLILELVASEDERGDGAWIHHHIGDDHAIRGVHSVTLMVRDPDRTVDLLTGHLGFRVSGTESDRIRLELGGGGGGRTLDLIHRSDAPEAVNGLGTVHHVALAVSSDEEQISIQEELRTSGFNVTDVRDRHYFRSIYFREPGGVLLEIATEGPGFLVDETEDELGAELRLPPWEEHRRDEIERSLPTIAI